ncbi:MAG: hypothetical protein ACRECO_17250 [Xanthobacteraceae bacterium]
MSHYLQRQAELCIALSRATIDLAVASRLRAMAADLRAKASECGDDLPDALPHESASSNSARAKASRS